MDPLSLLAGILIGAALAWVLATTRERTARVRAETLLEASGQKLATTFQALAADSLRSNNQAFLDLARQTLETARATAKGDLAEKEEAIRGVVTPLKEALSRYDDHLARLEQGRSALDQQLKDLTAAQDALRRETSTLSAALRNPQVRGRWGELTLRRTAELAGMVPHCDFVEQVTVSDPASRLRPDMVVRLPSGRQIVVDAKVPLDAYLKAIEFSDEAEYRAAMAAHVHQIRAHMTVLAGKGYWDQFPQAPAFVVMFIPGESFLAPAAHLDPALIESGLERHVILATPTTLISLLKAVAYGWQQQQLAENAREISDLGRQLHERIRVFTSHLAEVGAALNRSTNAYNQAVGSLESRVLPAARRFRDLGAATSRDIPPLAPVTVEPRSVTSLREPDPPAPLTQVAP